LINDSFEVKLTEQSKVNYNANMKGLEVYIPPEIQLNEILKKKTDLFKCDIYALGIIFYFILFKEYPKKLPYKRDTNSNRIISREMEKLLSQMLIPEPDKRPTINGVRDHEWVKKFSNEFKDDLKKFSYLKNKFSFTFGHYLKEKIKK